MTGEIVKSEMEEDQKVFHRVVDSASEFLKAMFPYGYKVTKSIKERRLKKKAIKEAEAKKSV